MNTKMKHITVLLPLSIACVFLSGCCNEDFQLIPAGQANMGVHQEHRKGYFSLVHMQTDAAGGADGCRLLSLASADLNRDGMPDLVAGCMKETGGILRIQPGNSSFREGRQAGGMDELPFGQTATLFEAPIRPDFLSAGDLNQDGFADLLLAEQGNHYLYWAAGNGAGEFADGALIPLPGNVNAMRVADFDRPSGAPKVMLGLQGDENSQLIIYSGNRRSPFTQPEVHRIPGIIRAFETGMFNSDSAYDLAILADSGLWILNGNDRFTAHPVREPHQVHLPFTAIALAAGNFGGGARKDLALLSDHGTIYRAGLSFRKRWRRDIKRLNRMAWTGATQILRTRMTARKLDDLAVFTNDAVNLLATDPKFDRYNAVAEIPLKNHPAAALALKLNSDALYDLILPEDSNSLAIALTQPQAFFGVSQVSDEPDADTGDGVCDVDLGTSGDQCTLRAAIQQANASPGLDSIEFLLVSGSTITPLTPLPPITEAVDISSVSHVPIEISGANPGAAAGNGLQVSGGDSTVRDLIINRFNGSMISAGLVFDSNGNNELSDCRIGTDQTGTLSMGNSYGLLINNSSDNTIGSLVRETTISGNVTGVQIQGTSSSNVLEYCSIGTTFDNSGRLGNTFDGIYLATGTTNSFIQNSIISANGANGLRVLGSAQVTDNYIGTNSSYQGGLGNSGNGIMVQQASIYADDNVIVRNGSSGVTIRSDGSSLTRNSIGTDPDGALQLGNLGVGVLIEDGSNNELDSNIVAYNFSEVQGAGVRVQAVELSSIQNKITMNAIYSNSGVGIDLGIDDVTPNDAGDTDSGANNLQNFPVLISATSNGSDLGVQGTLNSLPNEFYQIEIFSNPVCDSSGNGEGRLSLHSSSEFSDSSGNLSFSYTINPGAQPGEFITATATHIISTNPVVFETSEFSNCIPVLPPTSGLHCTAYISGTPIPGQDVYISGLVQDENDTPAPGVPLTIRISTGLGVDAFETATTDANGLARSSSFTSLYPVTDSVRIEGPGFFCTTLIDWDYCLGLPASDWLTTNEMQELQTIRLANPELNLLTSAIETELRSSIQKLTSGGDLQITRTQQMLLESLLEKYIQQASPPLRDKLLLLRDGLANGNFLGRKIHLVDEGS